MNDAAGSVDLLWPGVRRATAEQVGGLADLVWPRFVEVNGCVLLAEAYTPRTFDDWWARYPGQVERIERVINHVHLYDVLPDVPEADLMSLRDLLERTWPLAVKAAFPHRSCKIFVSSDDDDYGPGIGFVMTPPPHNSSRGIQPSR